ncbi:MAG: hypothetical protein PHP57_13765 [Sideroxydans sp.]|nr:hypothetical protein [Sideroxydans sp.]
MIRFSRPILVCLGIGLASLSATVNAASEDELIEAAWTCNPILRESGIAHSIDSAIRSYKNAGYGDDITRLDFAAVVRGSRDLQSRPANSGRANAFVALELSCAEPDMEKIHSRGLTEAFINKYVTVEWTEQGVFKDSIFKGTVNEFRPRLKANYTSITYKISFTPEYYSRIKAIEELQLQQKDLAEKAALAKQTEAEAARQSLAPRNLDKLCTLIKTNDVYVRYAKLAGDAVRGGYYEFSSPSFELEPENLLSKWYAKNPFFRVGGSSRFRNMNILGATEIGNRVYSTGDNNAVHMALQHTVEVAEDMKTRIKNRDDIMSAINSCVDETINTDLAYIFFSPIYVAQLRELLNSAKGAPTVTVRDITEKGQVVERAEKNPLLRKYEEERDVGSWHPHWLTLIYGGEEVLKLSGEDFIPKAREFFDYHLKELALNSQKSRNKNKAGRSKEERNDGGAGSVVRL